MDSEKQKNWCFFKFWFGSLRSRNINIKPLTTLRGIVYNTSDVESPRSFHRLVKTTKALFSKETLLNQTNIKRTIRDEGHFIRMSYLGRLPKQEVNVRHSRIFTKGYTSYSGHYSCPGFLGGSVQFPEEKDQHIVSECERMFTHILSERCYN